MPIAPITGTLRKSFFTTLSLALGLGTAGGYTFWYAVHLPHGTYTAMFTTYNASSPDAHLSFSEKAGGVLSEARETESGEFVVKKDEAVLVAVINAKMRVT
ncbi:hypothetical protein ACEPAG_4222 [Sanghuangporus baumii]